LEIHDSRRLLRGYVASFAIFALSSILAYPVMVLVVILAGFITLGSWLGWKFGRSVVWPVVFVFLVAVVFSILRVSSGYAGL
jgi:hypothetical protein